MWHGRIGLIHWDFHWFPCLQPTDVTKVGESSVGEALPGRSRALLLSTRQILISFPSSCERLHSVRDWIHACSCSASAPFGRCMWLTFLQNWRQLKSERPNARRAKVWKDGGPESSRLLFRQSEWFKMIQACWTHDIVKVIRPAFRGCLQKCSNHTCYDRAQIKGLQLVAELAVQEYQHESI